MESKSWTYTAPSEPWTPHPFQEKLVVLMLRQAAAGALLDPGLGKTSCALMMISILKAKEYMRRALIIAPLRPLYNVWPAEIAKWSNFNHLKYHIFHGPGRVVSHIPEDTDIILANPEGMLWLMDEEHPHRLEGLGVDVLIIDESTRFKDSSTKRFKKLRKVLNQFKRRYILTGSITPNGISDLFGQIFVLDQGHALGQYITHFRRKYLHQPDPYGNAFKWEASPYQFQKIVERISPLVLQLQAEDYLDMPDLINSNVPVELPEDARRAYDRMEKDFMVLLHEGATLVADNAAVVGGKCRQIANGAVYVAVDDEYEPVAGVKFNQGRVVVPMHKEKIAALEDLLEELQGAPALVLYEFQHDRDAILERWPDTPVLGGGVSPKEADIIIRRFNAGDYSMLCGHPASMGHGLNLQEACHHVIWYGITWNFEHYDQAIRRVYRQGQKAHTVFVYHIMANRTLDQKVLKVLGQKKRGQLDLLNALIDPL